MSDRKIHYCVFDDGILCDCVSRQDRWDCMTEIEPGHFICTECDQQVIVPFVNPGLYHREPMDRVNVRLQHGIRRLNLTRLGEQLGMDPLVLLAECKGLGIIQEIFARSFRSDVR